MTTNKVAAKGSLDAWAKAAHEKGVHAFKRMTAGVLSKPESLDWMITLNLPRWDFLQIDGEEFADDHENIFSKFDYPLYFVRLLPKVGHQRFSWINYTKEEILANIQDEGIDLTSYNVALMESEQLDFGGNIITNESGTVVELVDREHIRLAYGTHTPLVTARYSVLDTSFRYKNLINVSDEEMEFYKKVLGKGFRSENKKDISDDMLQLCKKVIVKALHYTRLDRNSTQKPDYFPGYYEFGAVMKEDIPEIVFFEYQNGKFHTSL